MVRNKKIYARRLDLLQNKIFEDAFKDYRETHVYREVFDDMIHNVLNHAVESYLEKND